MSGFAMPNARFQGFSNTGVPLANGSVTFYIPSTTTPKATWQDPALSVLNTSPTVALDAGGRADIFGSGSYRVILKDSLANTIYDKEIADPVADAVAALAAAVAALAAAVPLGLIVPYGKTTAPTNWMLCYGQAISRTTYSALFAVIGTTFGIGDGSTTFNLPDMRGRAAFGKDDMGGATATRITNAGSGIVGTTMALGSGTQLAPSHGHTLFTTGDGVTSYPQVAGSGGAQSGFLTPYVTNASSGAVNPAYTGTTGTGSFANMPPLMITTYIIYVGA